MLDNGYIKPMPVWTEDSEANMERAESNRTQTPSIASPSAVPAIEAAAADIRRDCDALRAQLRETVDFAQSQWQNARLSSQVLAYEQVLEDCQAVAQRNQARSERSARSAHTGLLRVAMRDISASRGRDVSSSRERSREPMGSRIRVERASSEQPQRNWQWMGQPAAGPRLLRDPSVERIAFMNAAAATVPPVMVPNGTILTKASPMPPASPGSVAFPAGPPRHLVPPSPMAVPPQLSARGTTSARSLSMPSAPPNGLVRSHWSLPPSPASVAGHMLSPPTGRVVFPASAPPPPQPGSVAASPAGPPRGVRQMVYVAAPPSMPSAREGLGSSIAASPMYAPSTVLSPTAVPIAPLWVGQSAANSAETPLWAWPNDGPPKAEDREEDMGDYVSAEIQSQAARMLAKSLQKESMQMKGSAFRRWWRRTVLTDDEDEDVLRRLARLERQRMRFREPSRSSPRRSPQRQVSRDRDERDGVYEALTRAAHVEGRSAAAAERLLRILLGLRTTHLLLQSRQRLAMRAAFDQLAEHHSAKLKESGFYTAEQTFTFPPREVRSSLGIGDRVLAKRASTGEYHGAVIASSNENGTVTVELDELGTSDRNLTASDLQKVPVLMLDDRNSIVSVQAGSNGNVPYLMLREIDPAASQQAGGNGRVGDSILVPAGTEPFPSSAQESALQVRASLPPPPSEPQPHVARSSVVEAQTFGYHASRSSTRTSVPMPAGPIDEEQLLAKLEEVQKEAQAEMQKAKRSSLGAMSATACSGNQSGQQESEKVLIQDVEFCAQGSAKPERPRISLQTSLGGKTMKLPMPTSMPTSFGPSGAAKDPSPKRGRARTEAPPSVRDSFWEGPEMAAAFGGPPSQPEVPLAGAITGAENSEYGKALLIGESERPRVRIISGNGGLGSFVRLPQGEPAPSLPQGPQNVFSATRQRSSAPANLVPNTMRREGGFSPPGARRVGGFSPPGARSRAGTNLRFASTVDESEECTDSSEADTDEWWSTGADKMSRRNTNARSSTTSRRSRADTGASATSARTERSASVPVAPHFCLGFGKTWTTQDVTRRPTIAAKALGIPKDASRRQVARAFYEGAKVLHPDKGGAKEDFQVLNEAYMKLSSMAPRDNVS